MTEQLQLFAKLLRKIFIILDDQKVQGQSSIPTVEDSRRVRM
ncbi:hypothetical protein L288_08745 [Sphingobium quisquiliarum P25]|uniref:Uncharacterized protein n=1 Tax=Sphingobium quisquiliarum P25 TaxID=1329909 RepID=T0H543_9SPHN|nr:hypothetical protein [Sphingobium quisquiliarum]EQB08102.1 hypothetical protein L288_08745 [Sphingobium quisquiliarum P25]